MAKNKIVLILIFATALATSSCNKTETESSNTSLPPKTDTPKGVTLGKKLENPYSVKNMYAACELLKQRGEISNDLEIEPTHLYIKLSPKDSTELTLIIDDTTLNLFPYPLDYELVGEGEYIIPENTQPELYTVIPIGHKMEGISYTIIEECCIPDENNPSEIEYVELESLKLTKNITEEEIRELQNSKCILPSRKYPQGRVTVYNTYEQTYVGVQGVKVLVSWFTKIASTYTDAAGNYHISKGFRYKTHYSAIFRNRRGFAIWSNWGPLSPAIHHVGRHDRAGHNIQIGTNSQAWPWATINNAACLYYDTLCPTFGVPKPLESRLRIWYLDINPGNSGNACTPMLRHITLNPMDLRTFIIKFLHTQTEGQNALISTIVYAAQYITPDIFVAKHPASTVLLQSHIFHEMGHASHFIKVRSNYWFQYIQEICFHGFDYGESYDGTNGITGIGEMWGYYFEDKCHNRIFRNNNPQQQSRSWFRPEVLHEIDDYFHGEYTPQVFFSSLDSDVRNHQQYKHRLISKHGNALIIESIFNQYHNDLFVIH